MKAARRRASEYERDDVVRGLQQVGAFRICDTHVLLRGHSTRLRHQQVAEQWLIFMLVSFLLITKQLNTV